MKIQYDMDKDKSQYDDKLAKQRIEYRLQRERQTNEDNLLKQEESLRKQESMKRATMEYEHQLKLKQDKERLLNKYNMRAELDRKNWDLTEKKLRITGQENRLTSKEVATVTLELLGRGFKEFVTDRTMMFKVFFGLTAAYVAGYGSKMGFNLLYQCLASRLLTPKLIRETSRIPLNKIYMYPVRFMSKLRFFQNKKKSSSLLDGIILNKELESQLNVISNAVVNRKRHYAPFRNFLFYGPPGTGKTLFARTLARKSGLDYAIMTGADVAPLGSLAVTELHKIFDWAETSSNGNFIINFKDF
jgi:ATPase family AAA domain-containing protein 3A/B